MTAGPNRTDAICNRHMARLLENLETAGCPVIFRDAVKSEIQWLRKDLNDMKGEDERHDPEFLSNRR